MARPIQELLAEWVAKVTTTVVVHPDDEERVMAALEGAQGIGPVQVITSSALPPGKVAYWTGTLRPDSVLTIDGVQP